MESQTSQLSPGGGRPCLDAEVGDVEVTTTGKSGAGGEGNEDIEIEIEGSPANSQGKSQIGKLDKDMYKPWGTCSRSSSDTGSDGTNDSSPACGKGGPGNASCGSPVLGTDLGVQCDNVTCVGTGFMPNARWSAGMLSMLWKNTYLFSRGCATIVNDP